MKKLTLTFVAAFMLASAPAMAGGAKSDTSAGSSGYVYGGGNSSGPGTIKAQSSSTGVGYSTNAGGTSYTTTSQQGHGSATGSGAFFGYGAKDKASAYSSSGYQKGW